MKAVNFVEDVRDKLVPIDQVRQHPDNPNNGDIDKLVESIQTNGFYTTITADRATGYILAGNHRYQALHALGAKEIPVVWVEKDRSGTLRILVGDNQTARLAWMDKAQELEILQELMNSAAGIAGTGHDFETMAQLAADLQVVPEAPDGFGHGLAPSGIYQVVIDFQDEDDRDDLYAEMADRYEDKARTVNL